MVRDTGTIGRMARRTTYTGHQPRPRPRRGKPDADNFDVAARIGNDDDDMAAAGVAVSLSWDGGAFFVPERLRNASPRQRALMQSIQDRVRANVTILAQLDELVAEARAAGLSWASIGWCVGLSEAGARKRWGGAGD